MTEYIDVVHDGKLSNEKSSLIAARLRQLEGKRVVLSVKLWRRGRTLKQNSFLWKVVNPFIVEMAYESGRVTTAEKIHEELKQRFGIKITELGLDGEPISYPKPTREYETIEMSDYVERVRAWCAELGWQLPFPREYDCPKRVGVIDHEGNYAEET